MTYIENIAHHEVGHAVAAALADIHVRRVGLSPPRCEYLSLIMPRPAATPTWVADALVRRLAVLLGGLVGEDVWCGGALYPGLDTILSCRGDLDGDDDVETAIGECRYYGLTLRRARALCWYVVDALRARFAEPRVRDVGKHLAARLLSDGELTHVDFPALEDVEPVRLRPRDRARLLRWLGDAVGASAVSGTQL